MVRYWSMTESMLRPRFLTSRRIRRDVKKRGRSIDSVIDQYLTTVKPMHELYVEPSKKNAHIIVPEGGKNLIALEMIINRIQRHIDASAD